jgi:hypothetical protein
MALSLEKIRAELAEHGFRPVVYGSFVNTDGETQIAWRAETLEPSEEKP